MTSGVSRSRSLPFSAVAGVAKASAINAMQTPRGSVNDGHLRDKKCVVNRYPVGVTCAVVSLVGRWEGAFMIRLRAGTPLSMLLAGAVFVSAATLSAQNSPPQNSPAQNSPPAAATHRATVDRFCISCHRGNTAAAGLHLDTFDFANFETNGATWEKLARKLRNREMPPADMRRPDEATYKALVEYIETGRDRLAELKPNPGRPTLHRLNRTEYGNAIRDLLALEMDVTELLPADDIGYGFDNIGDVLQVSPVLLERYLSTARKISRAAVGDTTIPVSYQTYDVPHRLIQEDRLGEAAPVGSRGGTIVRHLFPVDGEYEISVTLARYSDEAYLGCTRTRKHAV